MSSRVLPSPGSRWVGRARGLLGRRELVVHLASRELNATHRRTALGWSWPLLIQLTQLAVLSFVFGTVLPVGVDNYPVFVFCGLVFWTWFRGSLAGSATSVVDHPALILEPRMPRAALPLVSVAVATFDLLVSLPVLLALVAITEGLNPAWALIPLVLVVQAVLMAGIGLAVAAAHVYVRDVAQVVGVVLLVLFYMTPVFYPSTAVPEEYRWVFDLNAIGTLIDAHRAILLDGTVPDLSALSVLALVATGVLVGGAWLFGRLEPGMVDEL